MCLYLLLVILVKIAVSTKILNEQSNPYTIKDFNAEPEQIQEIQINKIKSYMNTSVNPCEDFYEYSCGNWANANPLHSLYGNAQMVLKENLEFHLERILNGEFEDFDAFLNFTEREIESEKAAKNYYKTCLHAIDNYDFEAAVAKNFFETLDNWPLADSNTSNSDLDWIYLLGYVNSLDKNFLLSAKYMFVPENGTYLIRLKQEGNSLKSIFSDIQDFAIKFSDFFGANFTTEESLEEIFNFDENFEGIIPGKLDESVTTSLADIQRDIPDIDWNEFFRIQLGQMDYRGVVQTQNFNYIKDLSELLSKTPSRIVVNYITIRFVYDIMQILDKDWNLSNKYSTRSEYCVEKVKENMEEILNQMFVKRFFDRTTKDYAFELFQNVKESFIKYIQNLDIADSSTKTEALRKLNSIKYHIGYNEDQDPSQNCVQGSNMTISDINIQTDSFFNNSIKLYQSKYSTEDNGDCLKNEILQYDVEAFLKNGDNLYISSGLLQPPFFNEHFPKWLNFGAMGYIMGHELTHAFSPRYIKLLNGSTFDWFGSQSYRAYTNVLQCYAFQYSHYKDMNTDVERALEENMSDNGGLKLAYEAYKKWLLDNEESEENNMNSTLNLTGEQLFFVSFAQTTCSSSHMEKFPRGIKTLPVNDPTKYRGYRIHGALSNSDNFSNAFQCTLGTSLNPVRKCQL